MQDTNQGLQQPTVPSSSSASLERRPSVDEDSAAMTIEYLRARLLSERSVSKAARQRAYQLSKKILELEERLDAEIQLRKKLEDDRAFSSNLEGEPGQSQISEGFDGRSQPDDVKEQLQCEDERDTEVERVLECQAELIEQFEAEENAQRAWEAKFEEAKALASHKTSTTQSISSSNLEAPTKKIRVKDGTIEVERIGDESVTRGVGKVHPEDCTSNSEKMLGRLIQPEIFERVEYTESSTPEKDGRLMSSEEESSCSVSKEGSSSQDEALPSTEDSKQERVPDSKAPAMDAGKSSKYNRHLSSSFRFNVFPDADRVTSTSPHMPGFTPCKRGTDEVEGGGVGKDEGLMKEASQPISGFGSSKPPLDDTHPQSSMAASVALHQSVDSLHASEDRTKVESQEGSEGILLGATSHDEEENSAAENGATDIAANPAIGNGVMRDLNREEVSMRRPSSLDGRQDLGRHYSDFPPQRPSGLDDGEVDLGRQYSDSFSQRPASLDREQDIGRQYSDSLSQRPARLDREQDIGRHYSDFAPEPETRGLGSGLQPGFGKHYMDFTISKQHPGMLSLPIVSTDSEGARYANMAPHAGNRSAMAAPVFNPNRYDNTTFRSQRQSLDSGFERVAGVLRSLQIAKYQIESADEQETAFAADDKPYRNGFDGREAYYSEPSHLPSVYAAPPHYTSPRPYLPRGAPPFPPNRQSWGYGAGPSSQLANGLYVPYSSRVPDSQSLWPPSASQGLQNSRLYHYDTRHRR